MPWNFPSPQPPPVGLDKPDPSRERALLLSLGEVRRTTRAIEHFLSQFPPTELVDAEGNKFRALAYPSGTGESSLSHPFKLVNASNSSGRKIRVVYGEINSVPPDGFSLGDASPYILNVVGSEGHVYAIVTVFSVPTVSAAISNRSLSIGVLPEFDSFPSFYLSLGSYSVSEEGVFNIAQAVTGSLHFELCGGVEAIWRSV